jgi:UDP-MurNAc hydroxylase
VVNANDIVFDDEMRLKLKQSAGAVDILLCGYTGAGPYPQTYFELNDPNLIDQASEKKREFFERYKRLVTTIKAKRNIPFAGKYILGGALSILNGVRGVADPVEVLDFDASAIVLEDDGGQIDTVQLTPTAVRIKPYSAQALKERIEEIKDKKFDYERLISENEIHQLPLIRLLNTAVRNAIAKSECAIDYFFCFELSSNRYAVINANKNEDPAVKIVAAELMPAPRSEIYIDPRYLFGLLTGVYHWNNAEIGSHFKTKRCPNTFNRRAQSFLNFLTVIG